MGLTLPTDHGSADTWDVILDAVFALIDAHDHTAGKGVKVPMAGLNVNADLSFSVGGTPHAISDLKGIDFVPVAAPTMAAFADAFFVDTATNELNYRNHSGTNIQVTSGAGLNMSLVGGIGGDYAAVGALLSFDDATDSYWFQQQGGPRPWARMRSGDVDIYETAASIVNRVRMKSPAALAASYDMTWFTALPASTSYVAITSAGQIKSTGVMRLPIAAAAFDIEGAAQAGGTALLGDGQWTFGAVTVLAASIDLPPGAIISSIDIYANRGGAGNITMTLCRKTLGAKTVINTLLINAGTGLVKTNTGAINHTTLTDNEYYVRVQCDNVAHVFEHVEIAYGF